MMIKNANITVSHLVTLQPRLEGRFFRQGSKSLLTFDTFFLLEDRSAGMYGSKISSHTEAVTCLLIICMSGFIVDMKFKRS